MPTIQNVNLMPQAVAGFPSMGSHSHTRFPLLQTVVSISESGLAADMATMSGGSSLVTEATGDIYDDYFLDVPSLGMTDVSMVAGGWYCYSERCSGTGPPYVEQTDTNLQWTSYGVWAAYNYPNPSTVSAYVTGYRTPAASIPNTGSATFNGTVVGQGYYAVPGGLGGYYLQGDATLQANFGTGAITGSLTNMMANSVPWNSVSLTGSMTNGVNFFSGTSAVTSTPGGEYSLNASGTGTFAGMFFGPGAQEAGAVWTLYDGTNSAFGTLGVSR